MNKKLLFVVTMLLAVAFVAFAADISGKWSWEQAGRGGNGTQTQSVTLKADGAKLTGSVPGFQGGDATEISNGKIDGNKVSWEVKRNFGDQDFVIKYEGVLNGDELKLKITRPAFGGGDVPPPTEVTAKRDK